MVRYALIFLASLWLPSVALSQTRAVDPNDLSLTVTLEELPATPFQQEMVLATIHGVYKRHITRETLEQPDFEGFNWMQMGQDHWYESMLDGKTVKNMRRRMALFPDASGTLEIGSFKHKLTLLDEDNNWFEHTIESDPLTLDVAPAPEGADWWFPVRNLQIRDDWSNSPDQLNTGEGVLRVVRVSALGASPDMIPPMPELHSPSAMIFAHPEQRLVDLTSKGPVAIAYWRWTIAPTNDRSAILEPIEFSYFNTNDRTTHRAVISAQRVAYEDDILPTAPVKVTPQTQRKRPGPVMLSMLGLAAFLASLAVMRPRSQTLTFGKVHAAIDRGLARWRFKRALWFRDLAGIRRAAREMDHLYTPDPNRDKLMRGLDSQIFGSSDDAFNFGQFGRQFLATLTRPNPPNTLTNRHHLAVPETR